MSDEATLRSILVVDDDAFLREFYSRVLTSQGYLAVCAGNGEEAIEILESETEGFDLLVVDLLMPICSGWDLIKFVRENPKFADTPILAVTGLSPSVDEVQQVQSACDAVMMKGDFEITKFSDKVASLIRRTA